MNLPLSIDCQAALADHKGSQALVDISAESSIERLQLFTPASNFYSRRLPPLGTRACNLNGADEMNFVINEKVLVRKFQEHNSQWTEWSPATVVGIDVVRGYVGSFAKRYIVKSVCRGTGQLSISKHLPFLFEIWPACCPPTPSISPRAYFKQREHANYVYALIEPAAHERIKSFERIWVPAIVLRWKYHKDTIEVQCLAGPDMGVHFLVHEVLPYTRETFLACQRQGDFVMQPDGTLDSNSFLSN